MKLTMSLHMARVYAGELSGSEEPACTLTGSSIMCMPLQVLAVFRAIVQDVIGRVEAGWKLEVDLIFVRNFDLFLEGMVAVNLPTLRWSREATGQPVHRVMAVSAVLGRVCIFKDYARPGGFCLHTRMSS